MLRAALTAAAFGVAFSSAAPAQKRWPPEWLAFYESANLAGSGQVLRYGKVAAIEMKKATVTKVKKAVIIFAAPVGRSFVWKCVIDELNAL